MKKSVRRFVFAAFLSCFVIMAGAAGTEGVPAAGKAAPKVSGAVFVDVYPVVNWSSAPGVAVASDEALGAFYDRPTLLTGGIQLGFGGAKAVVMYEFQQDIWSRVQKNSLTNLPDSIDTWYPTIAGLGTLYPNLGYVEYRGASMGVSLGRRKIKEGPGTIGLGISSYNPFYDNASAYFFVPLAGGKLGYEYVTVMMQRWQNDPGGVLPKWLTLHRASWSGDAFSLGVTEYNMVADTWPDYQDLAPFMFYHNLFNNHQNVMLGVDFTVRLAGDVSLYGEFLLDDVQFEGPGSNPNAVGLSAGAQWRILPGKASSRPAFRESDHIWTLGDEVVREGLTARLESYLASTFLWRRQSGAPNEAFTSRYQITSNWPGHWSTLAAPFFAAPLQPDTFLTRLMLDWNEGPFSAGFCADFRVKGSQCDQTTYDLGTAGQAGVSWLWPSVPNHPELEIRLSGSWSPDNHSEVAGSVSVNFAPSATTVAFNVGYGRRLGIGTGPTR